MRGFTIGSVVAGLLALAQIASANDHPNLDAKAILAQQSQIRAEASAGSGRYKGLEPAKRDDLFVRQDRVMSLLAHKTFTTELSESEQIDLFNDLEAIEGIVNKAEDERMVCERSKPVGSNRPRTVCLTVAQRRAEREAAGKQMEYRDQQCFKDSNGNCR